MFYEMYNVELFLFLCMCCTCLVFKHQIVGILTKILNFLKGSWKNAKNLKVQIQLKNEASTHLEQGSSVCIAWENNVVLQIML